MALVRFEVNISPQEPMLKKRILLPKTRGNSQQAILISEVFERTQPAHAKKYKEVVVRTPKESNKSSLNVGRIDLTGEITINCEPLTLESCIEEMGRAKEAVLHLRGKALEFRNFKLLADYTQEEQEFLKTRPDLINSLKRDLDTEKRIDLLEKIKTVLPNVRNWRHREILEAYLKGGSQEEAGAAHGFSRQRVHQIIKRYISVIVP